MNNLMIDLETLGRRAGCAIVSIGAVAFDERDIGPEFYRVINLPTCLTAGLTVDPETEAWWGKQSFEVRKTLSEAREQTLSVTLASTLWDFSGFWNQLGRPLVWSHGASFDLPILEEAYVRCGHWGSPWPYSAVRCCRTVTKLFPNHEMPKTGNQHNALDDARNQAIHISNLLRTLGELRSGPARDAGILATIDRGDAPAMEEDRLPKPASSKMRAGDRVYHSPSGKVLLLRAVDERLVYPMDSEIAFAERKYCSVTYCCTDQEHAAVVEAWSKLPAGNQ